MSNKKTFTQEVLHSYVAPSVSVLHCQNEGLLCLSGQGSSIEPGTEENWGEL